ncbi:MAG: calcium/sodium antiporter [Clostridia bacterium]|nr:calcium/sodium antiporter [Clostridia bacterium]
MTLFVVILLFLAGLILIIKGGDWFVDAAAWIAEVSGIPKVIVGATVVSLATTLPEIIVSMIAAFEGKADMAIGNAIGSVTANTGLILGVSLIFAPLAVRRRDYAPKAVILLAIVTALLIFAQQGSLSTTGAFVMLALFAVFVYENISGARRGAGGAHRPPRPEKSEVGKNVVKFIAGTAGIVAGAQLLVDNGSRLAEAVGVPESIIGVTLIAVGTSLPELVTAVTSLVKKQGALSVGNILGANIIDSALILPLCGIVSGKALPISQQSAGLDMPVCLLVGAIAFVPMLITGKFARWQGALLAAVYIGYICVLVI